MMQSISKSNGSSFKNSITGNIHSPKELSTGCKTLILIYKYSNVIFQARFGDNCTDLLEEIAINNDITIKSDYLHAFNFKTLSEIDLLHQFRKDNVIDILENSKEETLEDIKILHPHFYKDVMEKMNEEEWNGYN